jgi:hypothetical protein
MRGEAIEAALVLEDQHRPRRLGREAVGPGLDVPNAPHPRGAARVGQALELVARPLGEVVARDAHDLLDARRLGERRVPAVHRHHPSSRSPTWNSDAGVGRGRQNSAGPSVTIPAPVRRFAIHPNAKPQNTLPPDWLRVIQSAASEEQIVGVTRDYLRCWTPAEIARLPAACRPGRVRDAEDLARWGFELRSCHLSGALPPDDDALLVKLMVFVSEASERLAKLEAARGAADAAV